jgi:hypothetical protein
LEREDRFGLCGTREEVNLSLQRLLQAISQYNHMDLLNALSANERTTFIARLERITSCEGVQLPAYIDPGAVPIGQTAPVQPYFKRRDICWFDFGGIGTETDLCPREIRYYKCNRLGERVKRRIAIYKYNDTARHSIQLISPNTNVKISFQIRNQIYDDVYSGNSKKRRQGIVDFQHHF